MSNSSLRLASLVASIMIGSHSTTVVSAAAAGDSVHLPCADFSVGSSWTYATKSPHFTETTSVMVVENAGNKIRVAEKKTQKLERPHPKSPVPPPQLHSGEKQYQIVGPTIFQLSEKSNVFQIFIDPPVPVCGQIPSEFVYTTKITVMGRQNQSSQHINARAIGKETVTVPAGTYDAMVVEFRSKDSSNKSTEDVVQPRTKLMYAVKGVGVVKTVTRSVSKRRGAVGESDPRTEALMQEALAKMQKGEDISDVMKKMPVPEIKMKEVVNITIKELQSYAPGH